MAKDSRLPPKIPDIASTSEVDVFLRRLAATPAPGRSAGPDGSLARGRLIFAMDATARREPTWDRASHLQAEMFKATEALGGLDVQLLYYSGFGECRARSWVFDSGKLPLFITGVVCHSRPHPLGQEWPAA